MARKYGEQSFKEPMTNDQVSEKISEELSNSFALSRLIIDSDKLGKDQIKVQSKMYRNTDFKKTSNDLLMNCSLLSQLIANGRMNNIIYESIDDEDAVYRGFTKFLSVLDRRK